MFPPSAWIPNGAKPFGSFGSLNGSVERLERRVERVDAAVVEVGRVQPVVQRGEPVVERALRRVVDGDHRRALPLDQPRIWPACVSKRKRDDVLAPFWLIANALVFEFATVPVGPPGHRHGERVLRADAGVQRRRVGLVVRRPPRRGGGRAEAPAVHERRVGERSLDGRAVGDERVEVVGDERRRGAGAAGCDRGDRDRERDDDEPERGQGLGHGSALLSWETPRDTWDTRARGRRFPSAERLRRVARRPSEPSRRRSGDGRRRASPRGRGGDRRRPPRPAREQARGAGGLLPARAASPSPARLRSRHSRASSRRSSASRSPTRPRLRS